MEYEEFRQLITDTFKGFVLNKNQSIEKLYEKLNIKELKKLTEDQKKDLDMYNLIIIPNMEEEKEKLIRDYNKQLADADLTIQKLYDKVIYLQETLSTK